MADEQIVARDDGFRHSPTVGALAKALAAAQGDVQGARTTSANPFFKSVYADLGAVWEACRQQLSRNGLSVVQLPGSVDGRVELTTVLLHESGEWIATSCTAKPKDEGPQSVGSVLTYLRRYSLAAIAGVPQIDDDGEAGESRGKAKAKPASKPPVNVQTGELPPDEPPDFTDDARETPGESYVKGMDQPPVRSPLQSAGEKISEAQARRLFAISKTAGVGIYQLKRILDEFGVSSSNSSDIGRNVYEAICKRVELGPELPGGGVI